MRLVWRAFAMQLLLICGLQTAIMIGLGALAIDLGPLQHSLTDSLLLGACASITGWFLVVSPMARRLQTGGPAAN